MIGKVIPTETALPDRIQVQPQPVYSMAIANTASTLAMLVCSRVWALPFTNFATEILDFTAGDVRPTGTPLAIATPRCPLPQAKCTHIR